MDIIVEVIVLEMLFISNEKEEKLEEQVTHPLNEAYQSEAIKKSNTDKE